MTDFTKVTKDHIKVLRDRAAEDEKQAKAIDKQIADLRKECQARRALAADARSTADTCEDYLKFMDARDEEQTKETKQTKLEELDDKLNESFYAAHGTLYKNQVL